MSDAAHRAVLGKIAGAVTTVLAIFFFPIPVTAQLEVRTRPPGATVLLDGKTLGRTPLVQRGLAPGEYRLELRLAGYEPVSRGLRFAGKERLFQPLLPTGSRHRFLASLPTGGMPKEVKFSPDGQRLFVTPLWDQQHSLQVYSVPHQRLLTNIRVPALAGERGFVEGVFSPDGSEFWFSQMTTGRIHVLSVSNLRYRGSLATGGAWSKVIEFSPEGDRVLVSNWNSHDLSLVDVPAFRLVRRIPSGARAPRAIAWAADSVLVGGFDSGNLVRLSRADWRVIKRIQTGGAIDRIRLSPDGRTAWINNLAHDILYRYDMATDRITGRVRTGPKPNNVRLTPDGRYAYLACRGPNNPQGYLLRSPRNGRIQLVDLEAMKIIEDFEAGNQAVGLDVSPDGRFLAFTNLQDATVEIYTISDGITR